MSDDITFCKGGECPLRERCYRYTRPARGDFWWMDPPYRQVRGDCDYYLPVGDDVTEQEDDNA